MRRLVGSASLRGAKRRSNLSSDSVPHSRALSGAEGLLWGISSLIVFTCFVTIAISGCGIYSFNPKGKSSIKTIAIEPFENKTSEFGFTDRLTEIVTDAFIKDGNLKVVPSANADAVLIGTLLSYSRAPLRFDINDQVAEYKVRLEFEVVLRNPQDQSDILKDRFLQEASYDATTETEEDGQQRAGQKLVEAILNRTTKSW